MTENQQFYSLPNIAKALKISTGSVTYRLDKLNRKPSGRIGATRMYTHDDLVAVRDHFVDDRIKTNKGER